MRDTEREGGTEGGKKRNGGARGSGVVEGFRDAKVER